MSQDFLLGFVGALLATAYLTQLAKALVDKFLKISVVGFWANILTLPVASVVFIAFQLYQIESGAQEAIAWSTMPALTIIYATASSFAYETIIKRLTSR